MDFLGKITPIDRLSVKKFPSVQLSSLIPFNDRRIHTDNRGYLYILRKMYQSVENVLHPRRIALCNRRISLYFST